MVFCWRGGVVDLCIDLIIVLAPLMEGLVPKMSNACIVVVANQNNHTEHAICRAHNSWCYVLYLPADPATILRSLFDLYLFELESSCICKCQEIPVNTVWTVL